MTRDETAAAMQTLVMVSDRGEHGTVLDTPRGDSRREQSVAPAAELERDLAQAIRESRVAKVAQLAAEARRLVALEAAERVVIPAGASSPRITKEQFDQQNVARPSRLPAAKVPQVDVAPLVSGLRDSGVNAAGSKRNAGTVEAAEALLTYRQQAEAQIKAALDEQPGVHAGRSVDVELSIQLDGAVSGVRITRTSGDTAFDAAVRDAMAGLKLPPRPADVGASQRFSIRGVHRGS